MNRSVTTVPLGALARLAEVSADGLALLDDERHFAYVNPAGARILEVDAETLLGQPALVFAASEPPDGPALRRTLTSVLPGFDGPRVIERTEDTHGEHTVVAFRDVTGRRRRDRQLSAFAQTAAAITGVGRLQDVLDEVAGALLAATGTSACTIVLIDEHSLRIDRIGTAGGYPDDYAQRLDGCVRRGAPLPSLQALRTREAVVNPDWGRRVLEDPRWAPMHPVIRGRDWGALAAVPLVLHDSAIGSLTAFYPGSQLPADQDLAFLSSVAAQIAIAVHNHRLMSELEAKVAVEERNRIARELHDSVSQALFSLRLQAQAVRLANESDGDGRRDRVRAGLDAIQELTERAVTEMRALVLQLRPSEFRDDGIGGAIGRYAAAISARHDLPVAVECAEDLPAISEEAGVQVFRIVQEALGNVVRHADATRARVVLGTTGDGRLTLLVEDDGTGFDPREPRAGHLGLRTMAERSEELGGGLEVDSTPEGTRIRAVLGPGSTAGRGASDE